MKLKLYNLYFSRSQKNRNFAKKMLRFVRLPLPRENETESEFISRVIKRPSKKRNSVEAVVYYTLLSLFGPFIIALIFYFILKVFFN